MQTSGATRSLLSRNVPVTSRLQLCATTARYRFSCFSDVRSLSSPCRIQERCYSSSPCRESPLHDLRARSTEAAPLIFHLTSSNPYHNLAIEHYILTNTDPDSRILLFYTNRPCVVIGRNQNPWVESHIELLHEGLQEGGSERGRHIDLVRRRSGGGTVFHDEGNLNFSVIVPNDKNFSRRTASEMVVRALKSTATALAKYKYFDDIWVNERHDITMSKVDHEQKRQEFKSSGSAFKLTRGRALHHGTLLHSSANLGNISRLLRSPGRPYIQARGVESVRSPVSNLYWTSDSSKRDAIRSTITTAIVDEFEKVYGSCQGRTYEIGDHDCEPAVNPEVTKGAHELMTNEWVFEQTPRFDFTSQQLDGQQVKFSVKNGIIEGTSLKSDNQDELDDNLRLDGKKLHKISQWSDAVDKSLLSDRMIEHLTQVFPALRSAAHVSAQDGQTTDETIIERSAERLIRRVDKVTSEVEESGQNLVVDSSRGQ